MDGKKIQIDGKKVQIIKIFLWCDNMQLYNNICRFIMYGGGKV